MSLLYSHLRLWNRPSSPRTPPASGKVDIYSDPDTNTIRAMDADGNDVPFYSTVESTNAVLFTPQSLDGSQQSQARSNVGISTSLGGLGAADNGKFAVFGASGDLGATLGFSVVNSDGTGPTVSVFAVSTAINGLHFSYDDGANTLILSPPSSVTGNLTAVLPAVSGTVGVLGAYASAAAADAALDLWECWWDTAENKVKVNVENLSSDGSNGAADGGKLVAFGPAGTIACSNILYVYDESDPTKYFTVECNSGIYQLTFSQGTFTGATVMPTLTANREWTFPDDTGTVSLVDTVVAASPATGFTINASARVNQLHFLTPAGTLATGTFNLPTAANSRVGQVVKVFSSQTVTALTVAVSGGGTITGNAVTTISANGSLEFQCVSVSGSGNWARLR